MHATKRRNFLRFLVGSPLIAEALAQQPAVKDVLGVMDFEELARPKLPPAHWGYMATGVDDDLTLKANVAAYRKIQLRPRRLVDVSTIDTRTEFLGATWESPIFLCPVGGHRMFHPDGELGTARAAKATNTLQILSTQTSTAVEEVAKALGTPPWYQFYMPAKWQDAEKLVKRVEAAGCPVLVWTIDNLAGRNVETAERFRRMDTRDCTPCHTNTKGGRLNAPMFAGLSGTEINPLTATWDLIARLKFAHGRCPRAYQTFFALFASKRPKAAALNSQVAGSGTWLSSPKRPWLSPSGPAVKKSVWAVAALPPMPNRSPHNPSITKGLPFGPVRVWTNAPLVVLYALIVPSPKLPTSRSPPTSPNPAGASARPQGALSAPLEAIRRRKLPCKS